MDIIQALKEELQIGRNQVEAAVKLIDEGNTIPFIARYRKEATGSLNDEVLRQLDERLRYLRNLISPYLKLFFQCLYNIHAKTLLQYQYAV